MVRTPTFDYKFITIFRLLFCALTIMAFLMPWTYSPNSGLWGPLMYPPPDTGLTSSGYDYMVGCSPLKNVDLFVQMPYLIFTPILLLISMAFMFPPKRKFLGPSMAANLFSAVPVLAWYLELLWKDLPRIYLTYGLLVYIILLAINVIMGFITLKYSDVE